MCSLDYSVDISRESAFYSSIRTYYPSLPDGSLLPDYAGIRPKLAKTPADFIIQVLLFVAVEMTSVYLVERSVQATV